MTGRSGGWVGLLLLLAFVSALGQEARTYDQRGKVKSVSATEIAIESVDLPQPQVFLIDAQTAGKDVPVGHLVQVTFVVTKGVRVARNIAEIFATPINVPRMGSGQAGTSTNVNLAGKGSSSRASASSNAVDLSRSDTDRAAASSRAINLGGTVAPKAAPTQAAISLAADESQMMLIKGQGKHESGVKSPIRLAILDFAPTASGTAAIPGDLTADLARDMADRLVTLLQNDAIFVMVDRDTVRKLVPDGSGTAKAQIAAVLARLAQEGVDAVLAAEVTEDFASSSDGPSGGRHRIQAAPLPTINLDAHLVDTHTGQVVGSVHGGGMATPGRTEDHDPPVFRAAKEAVESLADAIDPDYPQILDSRTFVTVDAAEHGKLTVTFASAPEVQLGNRLSVTHLGWFTRDPATGHVIAVSPDPLGVFSVTGLDGLKISGIYQGPLPAIGETIRLSK